MWIRNIFIGALVVITSCIKQEKAELIPQPVISFYEGRDFWNNPIYIKTDTTVTGKKTRAIMAHFAAAAGIKNITVIQNGTMVLEKLEDNETKFNDEYLHPMTPEALPATFVIKFKLEDWENKVTENTITVNFK